jgi:hypothetical protein
MPSEMEGMKLSLGLKIRQGDGKSTWRKYTEVNH